MKRCFTFTRLLSWMVSRGRNECCVCVRARVCVRACLLISFEPVVQFSINIIWSSWWRLSWYLICF